MNQLSAKAGTSVVQAKRLQSLISHLRQVQDLIKETTMHIDSLIRRIMPLFCSAVLLVMTTSVAPAARKHVDLIMAGDYVVTMDQHQPVIAGGAVAIDNGKIVAVGPAEQIMGNYRAQRVLPGAGKVVMPGLINGHTHLAMALFR